MARVEYTPTPEFLARVCTLVNRESRSYSLDLNTCVFSSGALAEVLGAFGIAVTLMRVRAFVAARDWRSPTGMPVILGGDGDGTRPRAAGPGMWRGHLGVVVEDAYFLDPTLDQANTSNPHLAAVPVVVPITPAWLSGAEPITVPTGAAGSTVKYNAFPRRGGFGRVGDLRPTRRHDVVTAVLADLTHTPYGSKEIRRFWKYVDKTPTCWLWLAAVNKDGYGMLAVGRDWDYFQVAAHRMSYELHHGPIPEGMVVKHSCDVPACVRPDHLSVGTNQENLDEMVARGRSLFGIRSPRAVLNDDLVREIRKHTDECLRTNKGYNRLARQFGVNSGIIWNVIHRKSWQHVV